MKIKEVVNQTVVFKNVSEYNRYDWRVEYGKRNKKRSTNTRVKKKEHSIAYFDYSLLAILICLICFGLVMLYSTSSYSAMMKQNGDSCFTLKTSPVLHCGFDRDVDRK